MKAPIVALIFVSVFAFSLGRATASKPTVPLAPQIKRASLIAVAEIQATPTRVKRRPGDTQTRYRVKAKLGKVLKLELPQEVEFDVSALTFAKGKRFVVFLKPKAATTKEGRQALAWEYIDGNAKRYSANPDRVKSIEKAIAKAKGK